MFQVILSCDFQFGSKQKTKHMKIECIRLKPDHGQSARRGDIERGRVAQGGGQAAHHGGCSGPTSLNVVLGYLPSIIREFPNQISFWRHDVSVAHLFSCINFLHDMWRQTYIQK
jgi:hypothetical protein